MIKERKGDTALRLCDECGHEQWVNYWNIYRKPEHLCRHCSNRKNGTFRQGKYTSWNKGKRNNPRKVGSHYLNSSGYYEVWVGQHTIPELKGGYYKEHRLMAEVMLNKELKPEEIVHHIDGDKTNNTYDNLDVLRGNAHHRNVHNQLERLSMELVRCGLIKYDKETSQYYLDPFLRDEVSKSGELLGSPNEKDEGNQQRSLRDMSHEERSETIQKWSTLKRVEAPDTLLANLAEGDDIVPSPLKDGADCPSVGGKSGKG
jgi:hypothetical protein